MIGVFDSGLGGLTVVRRVRERLPFEDILFFADQAHVPYGGREPDDLHALLRQNLAWLDENGVRAIAMGCNTSCAIAERYGWPSTGAPVLDLIDSAATAAQRAGHRRIGVVATAATVASGSYGRSLRSAVPGAEVWEIAAPELVPLVEAGENGSRARAAVESVCEKLPRDLDAVVYGCTHYPVLAQHFRRALGGVALIDPAEMQAERAAAIVATLEPLPERGTTRYVTNGDPHALAANVVRILGETAPDVRAAAVAKTGLRETLKRTASS
ncbi:MAG TPA: glutamate racemase [Candidatus Tumulicola sp.]